MSRQFKQVHWTLESASNEFGVDRMTLTRMLKENGVEPSFKDGGFSTRDIIRAMFPAGDKKEYEQIRLISEQADIASSCFF